MFPMTITIHNLTQFNAVAAVLDIPTTKKTEPAKAKIEDPKPTPTGNPDPVVQTAPADVPEAGAPVVSFEEMKKAFLALSTKPDGRKKCQDTLAAFKVEKLSLAKEADFATITAALIKAGA